MSYLYDLTIQQFEESLEFDQNVLAKEHIEMVDILHANSNQYALGEDL